MNPPTHEMPMTEERVQRYALARQLRALVDTPAWRWWEARLQAHIDEARDLTLHSRTVDQGQEALRRWQVSDEVVSSIRYEISAILQEFQQDFENDVPPLRYDGDPRYAHEI